MESSDLDRDYQDGRTMAMSAREFFADREAFLSVRTVPSETGDGWDVVLRLDGTYHYGDGHERRRHVAFNLGMVAGVLEREGIGSSELRRGADT